MTAPVITMESVSAMVGKPKLLPKYVILDVEGIPTPVLFPAHLQHSDVGVGIDRMFIKSGDIISAGFYEVRPRLVLYETTPTLEVTVSGHSESLGVSHRPEDAEIIRTHLLGGK